MFFIFCVKFVAICCIAAVCNLQANTRKGSVAVLLILIVSCFFFGFFKQFCQLGKGREGGEWHGALYYTSPIVPPSGKGEGNHSRQRKEATEASDEADQDTIKGGVFFTIPARPIGLQNWNLV